MVRYPITLERDDNDTWLVSFPDFPEAHTYGETPDEAIARARDALATVIVGYMGSRRPIPEPSPITKASAELSALMSAKVELYQGMLASGTTKSALARRLNWHPPQVDRLFDLTHGSRVDQIEEAAAALGGRLDFSVHLPTSMTVKTMRKVVESNRNRRMIRTGASRARTPAMSHSRDRRGR